MRVDLLFEAEFAAIEGNGKVRQVEVAAASDGIGEDFAPLKFELCQGAVFQGLINVGDGVVLDGESGILKKLEVRDVLRIFEIDEDTDLLSRRGGEGGPEEFSQAERRKLACGGLLGDGHDPRRLMRLARKSK